MLEILVSLFYNFYMKRLFLLILCILSFVVPGFAQDAAELDDRINSLYAANQVDAAFNLLLSIPQEERTSHQWLILGNLMQDMGKIGDAEFMYEHSLAVDPKNYKASYNLANLYLANGKPNMAIEKYKAALKINNEFAYAYYNLGCAYIKIGEYRKAKNALLDAVYFKSTEPDFHYNLAYVYKKLNKTKDAELYLGYYNKLINDRK